MARTATRVDTQVKGKVLTLGGVVSGYFAGESNGAGIIYLNDANNAAQLTFDAGQSGSGNYQIETTGDVFIGGNLVVQGNEVVYDEVTIQSSAVITDNLTAGNSQIDTHMFTGAVLFNVSSAATATHITVKDVNAAGGVASLRTTDLTNSETFHVVASTGDVYTVGKVEIEDVLRVASNASVTGDFSAYGQSYLYGNTLRLGNGTGDIVVEFDGSPNDATLTYNSYDDKFVFAADIQAYSVNATSNLTIGNNTQGTASLTFDTTGTNGTLVWTGSSKTLASNANTLRLGNSDATKQSILFLGSAATGTFDYNSANAPWPWELDSGLYVAGQLWIDSNLNIGQGSVGNTYSLTFNGVANDGVITYEATTDTFSLTPMNYVWGDGAAADVVNSYVSSAATGVFKWDNAATGFDFDHKVKINGDLWVTGNIVGPGNPVAGLAQYALYGVSGNTSGSDWTLATTDSALGCGLEDESGSTYPIYLGPQGGWSGSEHLIPVTVTKNGLALIYGSSEDYTLSKVGGAIKVTFSDVPSSGDRLRAVFSRQK